MSAVRFTRIRCAVCDATAPSLVVAERTRLVRLLSESGWRLTVGEALCPECSKDESAAVPMVEVA